MKLKSAQLIRPQEGGPFSLKQYFTSAEYRLEMLECGSLYVQKDPHCYVYPANLWHGEPEHARAVRAPQKPTAEDRAAQRAARPSPSASAESTVAPGASPDQRVKTPTSKKAPPAPAEKSDEDLDTTLKDILDRIE